MCRYAQPATTKSKPENGGQASDFAMSQPAFVPDRHEVWFTDGTSGFYALKVTNGAWPSDGSGGSVLSACTAGARKTYTLKLPRGARAWSVRAYLRGKRVRVARVKRSRGKVRVTMRVAGLTAGTLRFRVKLTTGKTVKRSRTFKGCAAH